MHLLRRSCLAAALLSACPLAGAGTWSTHGPYGGDVSRIAAGRSAPTTPLWAYGNGGVFRSADGGMAWSRVERGLPPASYFVDLEAASDAPVAYLASEHTVYRSRDAGDEWVPTLPNVPGRFVLDVALRGHHDHVAVLTTQGVSLSTDGGATWADAAGLDPAASYGRLAAAADGTLYLSVDGDPDGTHGGARLLRSTTWGASWTPLALPPGIFNLSKIFAAPETASLVYITDGTALFGSADAGTNWYFIGAPANCYVETLETRPGDPLGLYLGCFGYGAAYAPNAASAVWTTFGAANGLTVDSVGDTAEVMALAALPPVASEPPTLVAGSAAGGLLRTTDGGATWMPASAGYASASVRAIATHPADARVFLAGQADTIGTSPGMFRSTDAGASWHVANAQLNAEQIRAVVIDPTTVDADPATDEPFTVYAAGHAGWGRDPARLDGGIYKSTDRGATWTAIDNGITVVGGRRDMGLVRALYLDPRSCASPPASGPCAAGAGPLRRIFAAGVGVPDLTAAGLPYQSARIWRSDDAGMNWTASDNGLPLPVARPSGSIVAPGGVIALVGDPANGDTLYAGTSIGSISSIPAATSANGVFKSIDGGQTWTHASAGLPRVGADGTSHHDVFALALDPHHPQVLYAATSDPSPLPTTGAVYRSTDGGATWTARTSGIAGRYIRGLAVDAGDTTGNTVYAAVDGDSANPGGVYRTTDGGATWNSLSQGLPAGVRALALPPRAAGAPARVLAGTASGVWDYTPAPDGDDDGAPDAIEQQVGDGNIDGVPDATQRNVASFASGGTGSGFLVTTAIVGGCAQLNDSEHLAADRYASDPLAPGQNAWGLVRLALPACANAVVDVTFHGANFAGNQWFWRNYGPTTPGRDGTFGWSTFSRATRLGPQTWRLTLDAARQGNWRGDANAILVIGGPAELPGALFTGGFE